MATPVIVLLLIGASVVAVAERAWNGHVLPGSTTPSDFTPYYVAPGSKGFDASSPLISYLGQWEESFSVGYAHHMIKTTSDIGASVSFSFAGTGIEWFGNVGRDHGIAQVSVDDLIVTEVDLWNDSDLYQQRVFQAFDLNLARHVLKIKNTALSKNGSRLDLNALVVASPKNQPVRRSLSPSGSSSSLEPRNSWRLDQAGLTGVNAMQLAIISSTHAVIIDKVEHNPLSIHGHPAWATLYDMETHELKPLSFESNSFCAGGSFLGNGSLINVGGNPVVADYTSSADFGDSDGLQSIRILEPCLSRSVESCDIYEDHSRLKMASPRWYSTSVRLQDGSVMVIGGSKKGGWINNSTVNNPTIEFFPPKAIHGSNGIPVPLSFLVDTLNSNLFPVAFLLSDGRVFVAANQDSMIYDYETNTEKRLPQIPNGVRVTYPMAGVGLLLPLSPENDYTPEVLLCGGSTVDDHSSSFELSAQDPATAQCSRMKLTDDGIAAGWEVEQMPEARVMPDAVLLPTGEVVIVNGASSGISGYGNVRNQVGSSNADQPVLTPVLYDPIRISGQRFSSVGMPTSEIPRMYHSVASLTPQGDVMIAGSNPNLDRSEERFRTEYKVEWLKPPYMGQSRPVVSNTPKFVSYSTTFDFKVDTVSGDHVLKVALMDLGFITHAVHANSRLVYLKATWDSTARKLSVSGPPNANVYPPGPGWIFTIVDGVPSVGFRVMVGE